MPTPAFVETVRTALAAADCNVAALERANAQADAVGHLLVLPMIVEAVRLRDQLRALELALAESLPAPADHDEHRHSGVTE